MIKRIRNFWRNRMFYDIGIADIILILLALAADVAFFWVLFVEHESSVTLAWLSGVCISLTWMTMSPLVKNRKRAKSIWETDRVYGMSHDQLQQNLDALKSEKASREQEIEKIQEEMRVLRRQFAETERQNSITLKSLEDQIDQLKKELKGQGYDKEIEFFECALRTAS